MINIPLEFMIYVIAIPIAVTLSITYYIFDLKRTDEENKVKKNSVTSTHGVTIEHIIKYKEEK
ncbi:MAG: hypothetical protein VYE31_02715 [Pseudomonadota bacterium]|nr:hypothetical protein [Pseudomonadota bacterium]